jgi:thymidine phosphorylase
VVAPAQAEDAGTVLAMDTRALGEAAVALGAGRRSLDDRIDPAVGFVMAVEPGSRVEAGDPLAIIHAATEDAAAEASEAVRAAIRIGDGEASLRPLVSHRITAAGPEALT